MGHWKHHIVIAVVLLAVQQGMAVAQTPVLRYQPAESIDDTRHAYPIKLLKLALSKVDTNIRLEPSASLMTQSRALAELIESDSVDVVWSATTRQREEEWLPIRIPIYKGLLGYRIFLYKPDSFTRDIATLSVAELKQIHMIQGHDWPDIDILKYNHFSTLATANYDASFRMLALGRVQLYPRSVTEIHDEWLLHKDLGLSIEPDLMLRYTMPEYFFVSRKHPELQQMIETGMRKAIADGSFDKLFDQYWAEKIAPLHIEQRQIIELDNPLLPDILPDPQSGLWYQPPKQLSGD